MYFSTANREAIAHLYFSTESRLYAQFTTAQKRAQECSCDERFRILASFVLAEHG